MHERVKRSFSNLRDLSSEINITRPEGVVLKYVKSGGIISVFQNWNGKDSCSKKSSIFVTSADLNINGVAVYAYISPRAYYNRHAL